MTYTPTDAINPVCACVQEVRAMLAHAADDFDYESACHCRAYATYERCDCNFCANALGGR